YQSKEQRDIGYFNNLKADSRNVTNSMTFATKSSNQDFIIFLNKIQTTIIGYKSCDFFAILDKLDPDTLPDGRIWLFGFNPYFFQYDSLCVGSASKRVGLQGCAQMGFLVLFIMPLLISSVTSELPGSTKTATLAHPAGTTGPSKRAIYSFLFLFLFFIFYWGILGDSVFFPGPISSRSLSFNLVVGECSPPSHARIELATLLLRARALTN
uniref:Uncharacterized protein n=1 Tax=Rhinolophus ferrumequinum TaxID=59479 RepID=A0A671G2G7_RHIFE